MRLQRLAKALAGQVGQQIEVVFRLARELLVLFAIGLPIVVSAVAARSVSSVEPVIAGILSAAGLATPILSALVFSGEFTRDSFWKGLVVPLRRAAMWGASSCRRTLSCAFLGLGATAVFWLLGPGSIVQYPFSCFGTTTIQYSVLSQARLQSCSGSAIVTIWSPLALVRRGDSRSPEATFRCSGGGSTLAPYPPAPPMREQWICPNNRCPADMVFVPGGFRSIVGSVRSLCLDRYEVTVADFNTWSRTTNANLAPGQGVTSDWPPSSSETPDSHAKETAKRSEQCNGPRNERSNHPMNCVDFRAALAYCQAQSKRLPTGTEWYWAATGADAGGDRLYPWGNGELAERACLRATHELSQGSCAIGSYPKGQSDQGVFDLIGNVWEWTASSSRAERLVMGGAWGQSDFPWELKDKKGKLVSTLRINLPTSAFQPWFEETVRSNIVGFRCATPPRAE